MSIAEIIGKKKIRSVDLAPGDLVEDHDGWCRRVLERQERQPGNWGWRTTSGWFADGWFQERAEHVVTEPTVDEMLAWLQSLDAYRYFRIGSSISDDGVWVEFNYLSPTVNYLIIQRGPTLHAALEAAVLAIHEREPQWLRTSSKSSAQ